jgi:hypothetical protein
MDSNRKTALIAGTLFIAGTAGSLLGTAIAQPVVTGTGYLTRISENVTRVSVGGLFELVAAGASAGIAISLYPVLKRWSGTLALGAVVFRAMEAVMYTVGAATMLALLNVAHGFTQAASANRGSFQASGDSLLALRNEAILAGVFAFAVGGLMYYVVFYRSRMIPRWLSSWGIAAELLMLVACLSALFTRNPVTSYTILILPIAVQEMVMAVWLMVKGLRSTTPKAATLEAGALASIARLEASTGTDASG